MCDYAYIKSLLHKSLEKEIRKKLNKYLFFVLFLLLFLLLIFLTRIFRSLFTFESVTVYFFFLSLEKENHSSNKKFIKNMSETNNFNSCLTLNKSTELSKVF